MKALAKELKIPVIVLSQLSPATRSARRRQAAAVGLARVGSIEQDADIVGLLVRPEVYEDDIEAREQLKGKATLYIAKQRNGPARRCAVDLRHEFTRFEDAARITDDDMPRRGE